MRRQWYIAVVISVALLLCGCASPKDRGVRVGMTKDEVHELIGPPPRKSSFSCPAGARNCPEVWKYYQYNVTFFGDVVTATR